MRKIIDLLIKNIHSLTFSFLLLFSFFQIIDKNYYQNSKFNFFSNSIINSIKENKLIFSEYFELREINEKLIIENTFLKNLKSISPDDKISYKNTDTNYLFNNGKIISNSIKFSKNFITINKGSNDKVSIDDGVISDNGLIGIVNNTSRNFSTLISILNTDLNINAKLKNSNHFGSLNWSGESYEHINLYDIPKNASIKIGDTILSGGMSAIFPEDIPIGKIETYTLPNSTNYYQIKVKLFEDMGSIKNIYIVKNNFKEEINNVEKPNEEY